MELQPNDNCTQEIVVPINTNVRIWLESYCTGELYIGAMAETIIFNLSIWGAALLQPHSTVERQRIENWTVEQHVIGQV